MANSIQEALAAVQRKINEQRMKNSESNFNAINEYALPAELNTPKSGQKPISSIWQNKNIDNKPTGGAPNASMQTPRVAPSSFTSPGTRLAPRPAPAVRPMSAAPAPAPSTTSSASSGDESNASYWNQEAARNKAAGNKPLPNEFNIFGNKSAASSPSASSPPPRPSQTPRPVSTGNPDVLKQQQALISQGAKIKADGIMGPQTAAAQAAQDKMDSMKMGRGNIAGTRPDTTDATVKAMSANAPATPVPTPAPAPASEKAPSATPAPTPAPATQASTPPSSFGSTIKDAASSAGNAISDVASKGWDMANKYFQPKEEEESGPSKGKKKMSESTLINSFLKLQETKAGNVFEAAKKMKTRYEGGIMDKQPDILAKTSSTDDRTSAPTSSEKTSWTDDEVAHNNSPAGLDVYAKQIQNAADAQYQRNKSMEPGDVGKGVDTDLMQKHGLAKATPTHDIQFADKPGQTFKAIGKDPGMGPAPASAPKSEPIPKVDNTSAPYGTGSDGKPYKTPVYPDDSETDNNDTKKYQMGGAKKSGPTTSQADFEKMTGSDNKASTSTSGTDSSTTKKPNLRYGYKTGQKSTNESFIDLLEKKAKKDWDGDGKIESEKDEVWGSRLKAAKKAGKIKAYRADRDKHGEMEEGVEFSDSELAHFASIAESAGAAPVDQGKANQKKLRAPQSERGIGETLPERDLTDEYNYEYMDEMARGVKAGQKRGSYKMKTTDLQGKRTAAADVGTDEGSKGVPHVLDQIRHGHEDEQGFKTITHPASSPEAPVTKRIHRSELHGFYDKYHNTDKPREKEKAYSEFLGKHFGDERATAPTHKTVTSDLSKVERANLKGGAGKVSLGGSKLVGGRK